MSGTNFILYLCNSLVWLHGCCITVPSSLLTTSSGSHNISPYPRKGFPFIDRIRWLTIATDVGDGTLWFTGLIPVIWQAFMKLKGWHRGFGTVVSTWQGYGQRWVQLGSSCQPMSRRCSPTTSADTHANMVNGVFQFLAVIFASTIIFLEAVIWKCVIAKHWLGKP